MNEIAVFTDILQSDIENMQIQLDIIKKDMNRMYEAVHILDGMWNGPANDTFNTQFLNDKSEMEKLCDAIQSIIKCLEFAKKEYDSCEKKVNSIISGITV